MSRPYFKLYGRDWRDGTRVLTPEERGLYFDLCTLIYDAGGPIVDDEANLARQMACARRVWRRVRLRLIELGKITLTPDGRLTNARAEREIEDAQRLTAVRSNAGAAGGTASGQARQKLETSTKLRGNFDETSPKFFQNDHPNPLKNNETAEAIASKAESEAEYKNSSSLRSEELGRSALVSTPDAKPPDPGKPPLTRSDGAMTRCVAAAGPGLADPAKTPGLHLSAPRIAAWLAAGCDLDADVIPVIQARTTQTRASPITTWSYFERAVIDARDRRLAVVPPTDPNRFSQEQAHGAGKNEPPRTIADQIRADRYASWERVLGAVDELEVVGPPSVAL